MKDIYLQYCQYNLWANQRITRVFSGLSAVQTAQVIESSFPSVKKTVLHIWDAELIWLKRLNGKMPDVIPSHNFTGTFEEATKGLLSTSQGFIDYLQHQSEEGLSEKIQITNTLGENNMHSPQEMIHHCMNHSTYHRGQLTTMARQLGVRNIPATDMIAYLRV